MIYEGNGGIQLVNLEGVAISTLHSTTNVTLYKKLLATINNKKLLVLCDFLIGSKVVGAMCCNLILSSTNAIITIDEGITDTLEHSIHTITVGSTGAITVVTSKLDGTAHV